MEGLTVFLLPASSRTTELLPTVAELASRHTQIGRREPNCITLPFDQALANFMAGQANGNDGEQLTPPFPTSKSGLRPPTTGRGCSGVVKVVCSPSSAVHLTTPTSSHLAPARATHQASLWSAMMLARGRDVLNCRTYPFLCSLTR